MEPFVSKHLQGVSRTYALLIPMLPRGLDHAVGVAYLLMRIVDTLEDDVSLPEAERARLLRDFDAVLARGGTSAPDGVTARLGDLPAEQDLMEQTDEVLRRVADLSPNDREATLTCARKMIGGVLLMQARSAARRRAYPAVGDAQELRNYCYYVAGVVGEMLCEMMAGHLNQPGLRRLRPLAVELGLGLQMVNILKDCAKDSKQGRRYLPVDADGQVASGAVYRATLAQARDSLEKGVRFVLAIPAAASELRSFCGLPIAWGALTLQKAETDGSKAKIDRKLLQWTIEKFSDLVRDDRALPRWLNSLIRERQPEPA